MLFSSMIFLWIFLPIVLIGSFITQRAGGNTPSNIFLLIASLIFYAWGEPVNILLMIASILINWTAGMLLEAADKKSIPEKGALKTSLKESSAVTIGASARARDTAKDTGKAARGKRLILFAAVVINLGLLGYFKYANLIVETINRLGGTSIESPNISLPIGISFFTFQALSYVIDVYRGECSVQKNPFKLALYISFFPQLIAGPIVKYRDIADEIDNRTVTLSKMSEGIRRFSFGLGKKVLIANTLAYGADQLYGLDIQYVTWSMALVASLFYTLQIYYDFSGYSDMAIGLGKMFGFEFRENFDYPYSSLSIREFWRRWHISLSAWFRDYVYIPLGGNRKGTVRTYINLIIVFFLTGLWHGAGYNFIFWGLFHGLFIILERAGLQKLLSKNRIIAWLYTMIIVNTGWIFFRIDSLETGFAYAARIFHPLAYRSSVYSLWEFITPYMLFMFVLGIIGMGPFQRLFKKTITKLSHSYAEIFYSAALILLSIMSLAGNTYNPFIYFRF